MDAALKDLYYDPAKGFSSLDKFYRRARDEGLDVSREDVERFVKKQAVAQVNFEEKKPRKYTSIYAPYIRYNYQLDILIQEKWEIDKYKYVLCCIDVYSRFAQCRVMTNRENKTIIANLRDIFKKMGPPERVNSDNEFNTRAIRDFFAEFGTKMYFSDPSEVNKNAVVERFNRSLLGLLRNLRTAGVTRWYRHVDSLVENYNTRYHRTIDATPLEVWSGEKGSGQIHTVGDAIPFKVGDRVRIRIKRTLYDKATEIYYSKSVYTIARIDGRRFILRNDDGDELRDRFKEYELRRAGEVEDYKFEDVPSEPRLPRQARRALKEIEGGSVIEGKRERKAKKRDDAFEWA